MNNVDRFFQTSHYNIIRVLLSICGIWPFHTVVRRYVIYVAIALVLGSGYIFEIMGVAEIWHDTFELVDSVPLIFLGMVAMSKIICAIYTLPKIKMLLIKMQKYCLSPKSDEEYKIQQSHALYGRNLGIAYTSIVLGHVAIFLFTTALGKFTAKKSKDSVSSTVNNLYPGIPYRVNYMVDVDTYFVPIFIHTTTCHISYMLLVVIFDALYLTLIEHCCGLFAALRFRLEHACEFENDDYTLAHMTTSKENKSYLNVAYCIRRHAEAIQFVTILESAYSMPLFIHLGSTILELSVIGYQVITNLGNLNLVLHHSSYLSGLLINAFFENWQGQKIIDSSEKVFDSAYNAEWYNMPIMARKLLIMIMMKSKKPIVVSVGHKFIVLSYVTFNAIVRMSMSYFMLLRSV
ncbi:odorant receptor 63a-like isoform X2 [Linepithema humile]|uniref:odorant receptor 63a-like isoform X2 n=1 Tax=Linepithema humile TaxID=83485 RepID=UPI00351EB964